MAAAIRPLTPLRQPPKVVKAKKNFLLFLRYLREKKKKFYIFAKIKNHNYVKNKNGIFLQGMRQRVT